MTKVTPYHSSNPTDPDVYHWHDNCPAGSQIPARNKVSGKGYGNRPCRLCERMD
ncbi:hypothetical protein [Jiangella mangrovi]|uniref:Uncharacterized protein n=1 Tax=Jiangella mangrovi TaxID=1524084 RepID=A0A7W9GLR2_9ACTN|nr:hypothetical protein [Jiangella mangrovi]MBB5785993.1 hypothetical protein [Jiangella mangrovi]